MADRPLQMCVNCDAATGRCAEDEFVIWQFGPLCEDCYREGRDSVLEACGAALLPPGAFVVADGPEAKDKIREVLRVRLTGVTTEFASCDQMRNEVADAVLAALREAPK